jgi:putative ABC transport system substrate-binding protein
MDSGSPLRGVRNDASRRAFLAALGGAAAMPLAARAQRAGTHRVVGVLGPATPASWQLWSARFERRLHELGWVKGGNLTVEYRWSDGHNERLPALATELVRSRADVIVTTGTGVSAARRATSDIPIVFAIGRDPIGDGLVASLARPDGNVTGLSTQATDLAGKRLSLLREIVPGVRKLAILNEIEDQASLHERREAEAAAHALGLAVVAADIRRLDDDLVSLFKELKGRADAIYCGSGGLVTVRRSQIFSLALASLLPSIAGQRIYAQAGSLMSYGADYADLFRRAAEYVDRILRGAKPSELPVEQPTKFELLVNAKTAKALGLNLPPTLLARADEVIE